jgi:hypothetical protein
MDQLVWVVSLVPERGRLGGADQRTSQWVALAQVGHPVAAQDPAHGAGRDPQLGTEPVLAAAVFTPGGNDLVLDQWTTSTDFPQGLTNP